MAPDDKIISLLAEIIFNSLSCQYSISFAILFLKLIFLTCAFVIIFKFCLFFIGFK